MKNFVDRESGVTVFEAPYKVLLFTASNVTLLVSFRAELPLSPPSGCATFLRENTPPAKLPARPTLPISLNQPVILGNPASILLFLPHKVDNYDNFLYNRKYERGIYKGCNGKIWGWTSTGARKEAIK